MNQEFHVRYLGSMHINHHAAHTFSLAHFSLDFNLFLKKNHYKWCFFTFTIIYAFSACIFQLVLSYIQGTFYWWNIWLILYFQKKEKKRKYRIAYQEWHPSKNGSLINQLDFLNVNMLVNILNNRYYHMSSVKTVPGSKFTSYN